MPAASAARAARLGDEEQDAASAGPGTNGCGHPGAEEPSAAAASEMDQCVTVERELEKVLHKFSGYGQLCERGLEELIDYTGGLKHEILQSHGKTAGLGARGRAHPSASLKPWLAGRGALGGPFPASTRRGDPQTRVTFPSLLDLTRTCPTWLLIKSERDPTRKPIPEPRAPAMLNLRGGSVRRTCKSPPSGVGAPCPDRPGGSRWRG